jgi:probable HAF family extracellular repeat protein
MDRARLRFAAAVATSAAILCWFSARHAPRASTGPAHYVLTDLGTLGGGSAEALDINDAGQVVGYAITAAGQGHAFLWTAGTMTDLGTLGGSSSRANSVNGVGQVAGASSTATSTSGTRAVLWQSGTLTDVAADVPANEGAQAAAVNDVGQVVGSINFWEGFVWQNGQRTTLGDLGGGGTLPYDINAAGQIVGASYTTISVPELGLMPHAFVWQNGVIRDLGVFPGDDDSSASAINSVGQIVGSSGHTDPITYETAYKPFVYANGVMTAIPVVSIDSYAVDINDSGVVVGTMRAAGGLSKFHAWIYADGAVTTLNSLIPFGTGLDIAYANAINNAGQIAGVAVDGQGRNHAVLLTPGESDQPPVVVPPSVQINDVVQNEGNSGTTAFAFTVSLSSASANEVRVNFATADGLAKAGDDYNATSGTLVFRPGETSKIVVVGVKGDRKRESDEAFFVNLSGAVSAVITDGQGTAVIRNDDR